VTYDSDLEKARKLIKQIGEQLDPVQRWYRILSQALKRYLGRAVNSTRRGVWLRPELSPWL
jgi:small-conductance mechanosensitive channel